MKQNLPVLTLVAGLLAGCAGGPTVQQQLGSSGQSFDQLFPIAPDKVNLFICRNPQMLTMSVMIDGNPTPAPLSGNSYLAFQLAPGSHQIFLNNNVVAHGSLDEALGHKEQKTVNLTFAAGRNYFFRTGIGFTAPKDLKPLSEEEGRKAVLGSHPPAVSGFIIPDSESGGAVVAQPAPPIAPEKKP